MSTNCWPGWDTDASGTLEPSELTTVTDTDGDGVLSDAEILAALDADIDGRLALDQVAAPRQRKTSTATGSWTHRQGHRRRRQDRPDGLRGPHRQLLDLPGLRRQPEDRGECDGGGTADQRVRLPDGQLRFEKGPVFRVAEVCTQLPTNTTQLIGALTSAFGSLLTDGITMPGTACRTTCRSG